MALRTLSKGAVAGLVVLLGLTAAVRAQQQGRLWVNVLAPDKSFKDHPFTASAICDGRIVFQQDGSLEAPLNKESVGLDQLPLRPAKKWRPGCALWKPRC